jgi:hypothetical protein
MVQADFYWEEMSVGLFGLTFSRQPTFEQSVPVELRVFHLL